MSFRPRLRSTSLAWPYLLGIGLLVVIPVAGTLYLAFTEYFGIVAPEFIGVDNFTRMLASDRFWTALGNSSIYVLIAVPLRVVGAVGFALLLHRRSTGSSAARTAVFLPTVVPDVAYALLWLYIFNPLFGPLTLGLESIGVPSPEWLVDPTTARFSVALMSAFQIGEGFVIALAVRRSIPNHLYESAAVDGASRWFTLSRVTLPLMFPVVVLLALRDVIVSFQANFVPALIVTEGGPRLATFFLPLYVYREGFRYGRLGYAAAVTLTMFVVTAVVVLVQYRLARRWRLV
ncbi:MAG: carbohydrate ABC transporter permease [Actinomycetota bacterium]